MSGLDYFGADDVGATEEDAIYQALRHGQSASFVEKGGGKIAWASGAAAHGCGAANMHVWNYCFIAVLIAIIFFAPRVISYFKQYTKPNSKPLTSNEKSPEAGVAMMTLERGGETNERT
jgi:hypothetical protein